MHWERARGSVPARVFFSWGTLEELCLCLYPLCGENKCTFLCLSWNWVLLTTYISSSGAVCFCVLLTPVVLQGLWILCLRWFEAELLRTLCVCRNSRLENEMLVSSKSFLKVWEYRPEKGSLFEAVSVLFMDKNSRQRVLTEWSEGKCCCIAKCYCCKNHCCPLVKPMLAAWVQFYWCGWVTACILLTQLS